MKQDFETYLQQARKEFTLVATKYNVTEHNELRTAIDSLLIAYDQAVEALSKHSVSGKQPDYKTINATAIEYAQNEWGHIKDVNTEKKYSENDFIAGAQWALSQVACASGAVDKTVSGDELCKKCGVVKYACYCDK